MAQDDVISSAVESMKRGEEAGFNKVYSETVNYVNFRARQIMNNEEDANDLIQIVYMEAYRSIKSLDDPRNLFAWLGSITYRQGMKLFRKKSDILLEEGMEDVISNSLTADARTQPEKEAIRKETEKYIGEIIEELPESQRTVVIAYYYDNIKVEEIAEIMECSVGTVKSRLSYARKFMKKKLEAHFNTAGSANVKNVTMLLSASTIFGAVQMLSAKSVMAAEQAESLYAGICSSLGIAAVGAVSTAAATGGVIGSGVTAVTGGAAGETVIGAAAGEAAVGIAVGEGTAAASGSAAAALTSASAAALGEGTAASAAAVTAAASATAAAAGTGAAAATAAVTTQAAAAATAATAATSAAAAAAAATTAATATAATTAAAVGGAATGAAAVKGALFAVALAVAGGGVGVGTGMINTSPKPDSYSVSSSENIAVSAPDYEEPYQEEYKNSSQKGENSGESSFIAEEPVSGNTVSGNTSENAGDDKGQKSPDPSENEAASDNSISTDMVPESGRDSASDNLVSEDKKPDVSGNEAPAGISGDSQATISGSDTKENDVNTASDNTASDNTAATGSDSAGGDEGTDSSISGGSIDIKLDDLVENYIAAAVASMIMYSPQNGYDGPITSEQLSGYYTLGQPYQAVGNLEESAAGKPYFIYAPRVSNSCLKDGSLKVYGSFVVGRLGMDGVWNTNISSFELTGLLSENAVFIPGVEASALKVTDGGSAGIQIGGGESIETESDNVYTGSETLSLSNPDISNTVDTSTGISNTVETSTDISNTVDTSAAQDDSGSGDEDSTAEGPVVISGSDTITFTGGSDTAEDGQQEEDGFKKDKSLEDSEDSEDSEDPEGCRLEEGVSDEAVEDSDRESGGELS